MASFKAHVLPLITGCGNRRIFQLLANYLSWPDQGFQDDSGTHRVYNTREQLADKAGLTDPGNVGNTLRKLAQDLWISIEPLGIPRAHRFKSSQGGALCNRTSTFTFGPAALFLFGVPLPVLAEHGHDTKQLITRLKGLGLDVENDPQFNQKPTIEAGKTPSRDARKTPASSMTSNASSSTYSPEAPASRAEERQGATTAPAAKQPGTEGSGLSDAQTAALRRCHDEARANAPDFPRSQPSQPQPTDEHRHRIRQMEAKAHEFLEAKHAAQKWVTGHWRHIWKAISSFPTKIQRDVIEELRDQLRDRDHTDLIREINRHSSDNKQLIRFRPGYLNDCGSNRRNKARLIFQPTPAPEGIKQKLCDQD
ncbi:hypothetical protein [Synechococcus sp. MIT S9507]|uniref:hypothetical protein n=1 Tax=Synechococcus sp. MIT S9507 TaxID=3082544 RepID=UPI0039B4D555